MPGLEDNPVNCTDKTMILMKKPDLFSLIISIVMFSGKENDRV